MPDWQQGGYQAEGLLSRTKPFPTVALLYPTETPGNFTCSQNTAVLGGASGKVPLSMELLVLVGWSLSLWRFRPQWLSAALMSLR